MAKVKRSLYRFPYLGILLVVLVLLLILFLEKKITPYVAEPNIAIQTPVLQTKVISYRPSLPSQKKQGSCFEHSSLLSFQSAWRCSVENQIHDPCLIAEDNKTVVCDMNPVKETEGFAIDLLTPLPEVPLSEEAENKPWIIQLASGRVCTLAEKDSEKLGDDKINYYCESPDEDNDIVIAGELKKGTLWNGKRVVVATNEPTLTVLQEGIVPLKTVWIVN